MKNYMETAYKEALKAYRKNEIPVGAVVVIDNKIVAKAHNNRQKKANVLGHAEINAIIKAEKKIRDWRLDHAVMYVTLMPCQMCQTIINEARIKKIYYLLDAFNVEKSDKYIRTNDCDNILKPYQNLVDNFFKKLRK